MGKQSETYFQRAQEVMPGGVNTPLRAFASVGGSPLFIEQGQGPRIFDIDNLQYIDCVGSGGPLILGHAHRYVVEAVKKAATRGSSFGAPTTDEVELAEMICHALPSMEMVRLVSSGTEAAMSAVRLARAASGRKRILKFDGGYHGHADSLLGSDTELSPGNSDSSGILEEWSSLIVSVPYNDLSAVGEALNRYPDEFAAVIVEPIAGNFGCVAPAEGFLAGLRNACDAHSTLLIFDEVKTGFRVDYGGAQTLYGIHPDITVLGQVIGGGLPIGAYGASKRLMQLVSPVGAVFQAGTMSGNPLAVAAGKSTLSILKKDSVYRDLEERSAEFEAGVRKAAAKYKVSIVFSRVGSMWTIFFNDKPVTDLVTAATSRMDHYARFFHLMLAEGVYMPPSQYEPAFFSSAHAKKDILQLIERTERVMKKLAWEFDR